ncbi:MAG: prenyltransferase/squalene oxidase repeat-containing protein [Planctomycetota bacterium]
MITNHQNSHSEEILIQEGSVAEKALANKFDFNLWFQGQLQLAPWWGISLAFHILLILFLASIPSVISRVVDEGPTVIEMKAPIDKETKKVEEQPDKPVEPEVSKTDEVEATSTEDIDANDEFDTESSLKGAGVYDTIGTDGGLGRKRKRGRIGRQRVAKPEGDAVVAGLIWLAKHQNPDGSWGAKSFQNQCRDTRCSGIGDEQYNIGLTGLSMLAFTGAGYTNSSRDTYEDICFGDVVRKGALYLTGIQLSDGTFGGVREGKFMYNQALATYAMADLYALNMDNPAGVIFREPVERAVKYILDTQNPNKGWRYQPKSGQNDTSVSGWVAMALKAAEGCNIPVPPEAFANIKSFYDDVTDKNYGKVGYTELGSLAIRGDEDQRLVNANTIQPSLTAIGIMVRIFIDKKTTDPLIKLGVSQILSSLPTWDTSNPCIIDYYYWFYASYCLNQYDGPNGQSWTAWNEKIKDVLLKHQHIKSDGCANGSWDPIDRWSSEASRIYCTATNVLTLEVYYRLDIVKSGPKSDIVKLEAK